MSVFGYYAQYYDLLYRSKNYEAESAYVEDLMNRYAIKPVKTILELGCGTGRHALLFAEKGYTVHAVDFSENMLAAAQDRKRSLPQEIADRLQFQIGDIRNVRRETSYNVVMALFHVMSYQAQHSDLKAVFANASAHLQKDGLFIFDVWYGPGVLTDLPVTRVKRMKDEKIMVTRIAEPEILPNDNLVDVYYEILVRNLKTDQIELLNETHRMRYLFQPELEAFMNVHDMELVAGEAWLTAEPLSLGVWNACFVGRKR